MHSNDFLYKPLYKNLMTASEIFNDIVENIQYVLAKMYTKNHLWESIYIYLSQFKTRTLSQNNTRF